MCETKEFHYGIEHFTISFKRVKCLYTSLILIILCFNLFPHAMYNYRNKPRLFLVKYVLNYQHHATVDIRVSMCERCYSCYHKLMNT